MVGVASRFAPQLSISEEEIKTLFLDGTRVGATPVTHGVALPHIRVTGIDRPYLVVVRSRRGLGIEVGEAMGVSDAHRDVHAVFYLVSPIEDPALHLRLLAQLAGCVELDGFKEAWLAARSHQALREVLLRDDRYLALVLESGSPAEEMAGREIRNCEFPPGCLIALVRRGSRTLVPSGSLELQVGDRLTIIGDEAGIALLSAQYGLPAGSD